MDENLFQLVTVGLLGVTLLVLLVTLLTLNKLTKKVDEGAPSRAEAPYQGEEHVGAPPGQVALEPSDASGTPEPAVQESPATVARAKEAEPVAERREPEVGGAAQVEEVRPVAAAEPSVQEPQPAQAASTGFEDAPQEQPFERDGRWWFKRGDELLVYDEQSGQWEAAPAGTSVASAAAAPAADSGSDQGSGTPAAGGEAESAQAAQDPGSFWKCPSCGAVNGSTATSCRMCFAPKP
jgi:hypothetical protein